MSGILTDVPTQRWMQRQRGLAQDVGELALESSRIDIDGVQDLVVRDILPQQDFDAGGELGNTVNGTGNEEWLQDLSSSGSNNSYNEAYKIDSNSQAEDKIIGIMGVSFLHSDIQTRQLRFKLGSSGNQGVKREVNVESVETDDEARGMFLTDVVFDANEHGTVEMYSSTANDGNRMVLHGYVAEPVSETLAEPSSPQLSKQNSGGAGASTVRR